MKKTFKKIITLGILAIIIGAFCTVTVFADTNDQATDKVTDEVTDKAPEEAAAEEENSGSTTGNKAFAAAICVGVAAAAGAGAMGIAISKSAEGISRQPEAADKIRAGMMLGLVFIETAIIYALIVAILIIFVL